MPSIEIDRPDALECEKTAHQETLNTQLGRLVDRLPVDLKPVILLFYYENHSVCEISKMLGLPLGTVKSRLFRARAVLEKQLCDAGLYDPRLWLETSQ